MKKMMYEKKALSPVVQTALLLVVAVAAVVAFQQWYSAYQSEVVTDISAQGSVLPLGVERITTSEVFIKNPGASDILGVTVTISGCTSGINISTLAPGISNHDVPTSCTLTQGDTVNMYAYSNSTTGAAQGEATLTVK